MMKYQITISGIRGIPAQHGGFETFAEKLSLYLAGHQWDVIVYCQEEISFNHTASTWNGIKRIHIPVKGSGAFSTVMFDLKVALRNKNKKGVHLLLGYNTATFNIFQRVRQQSLLINMDGIEWKRDKWGFIARTWFWLNEKLGSYVGNHLIADHPEIKEHLSRNVSKEKITMIPYGADDIQTADVTLLSKLGLEAGNFSVVIARPEPENSILEMVKAFSTKKRNHKLVVLGNFNGNNPYHAKVMLAASDEVVFPGAIYDQSTVSALRFFARIYLHGHTVGGTNPSLVEAMGAGCAVLAHDNKFNRWVAGNGGEYFSDFDSCSLLIERLLTEDLLIKRLKEESKSRYYEKFTWEQVLKQYEELLVSYIKE